MPVDDGRFGQASGANPIFDFAGNEQHLAGKVWIVADGEHGFAVVRRPEGGEVFLVPRDELEAAPINNHPRAFGSHA